MVTFESVRVAKVKIRTTILEAGGVKTPGKNVDQKGMCRRERGRGRCPGL